MPEGSQHQIQDSRLRAASLHMLKQAKAACLSCLSNNLTRQATLCCSMHLEVHDSSLVIGWGEDIVGSVGRVLALGPGPEALLLQGHL